MVLICELETMNLETWQTPRCIVDMPMIHWAVRKGSRSLGLTWGEIAASSSGAVREL